MARFEVRLIIVLQLLLFSLLVKGKEKPNYLFLITDDQTYNAIQALNQNAPSTPNMDRLVNEGVTFTHCFNQGSWSAAVCTASRTMLNTGQSVFRASKSKSFYKKNATISDTQNEVALWGEVMTKNGYATYLTGKWHNTDRAALKSFICADAIGPGMCETYKDGDKSAGYGREKQDDTMWRPWLKEYTGHWAPRVKNIIHNENGEVEIGASYVVNQHSSQLYADNAINYLQTEVKGNDKPFFMYVAFNAPHDPRQSPKKYVDMYPTDKMLVPKNFLPEHPFDQGDSKVRDEQLAPFPRTTDAVKLHMSEYYAIISHVDHEIGRILKALEQTGRGHNTYVILTSDHGLAVGQHGLMGKQNQYDHSVRMPLVIKGPGVKAATKVNEMVYMQSMFATTCEMSDISIPKSVDFKSLLPLLTDEKAKGEEYIFGTYKNLQRMIRSNDYKLIVYPQVNRVQLFDLNNDPLEQVNLYGKRKYRSIAQKMFKALKEEQKKLGDYLNLDSFKL